ncbi:hypothetical protein [Candidatus Mycobacterium methanotrophicum]|uniref:Uncharacterized protein n=1 Tax=Candidatus Mycobacterium methanotrophicum TaxID=2943498 RepID=A0ABY4QMV3_9MYCO|nr:hypothetical protein [Candidatus Mycobacterium methanotrophicum]UQX11280.1 hypothetical protein M5I08_01690 [Candidatus Mycobacterium methanotrophicum]
MTTPTTEPDQDREITAVLRHHRKAGVGAVVAHLSVLGTNSVIGVCDPGGRLTPVVEFLALPMRGADLLDEVGRIDENAPRLVDNYQTAFPDATERLIAFGADLDDVETPALGWLFLACGLVLSPDDADLAAARRNGGGPKVDTIVIEQDGRYLFDGRRLLRSLMSYRIADAPTALLANSVFESLGDFVADAIGRLLRDQPADVVVCAGDLFAGNRILRSRVQSGLARSRVLTLFPAETAE